MIRLERVALGVEERGVEELPATASKTCWLRGTWLRGGGESMRTTPARGQPWSRRMRAASKATTPPKDQPVGGGVALVVGWEGCWEWWERDYIPSGWGCLLPPRMSGPVAVADILAA